MSGGWILIGVFVVTATVLTYALYTWIGTGTPAWWRSKGRTRTEQRAQSSSARSASDDGDRQP